MIDRRTIMMAALAAPACLRTAMAQTPMSRITAYGFSFPALEGGDIRLAELAGRPFLVVNTASQCGTRRNMPDCRSCGRSFMAAA
jgi:glutathione peroxidase